MKKTLLTVLLSLVTITSFADLQGDGFYRVKNYRTKRYISVIDNKGSLDVASTNADVGAIQTIKYFERVATDPGSVVYFKQMGTEWDLEGQGTSVYNIINITVQLEKRDNGCYRAYKSMNGLTRYLFDLDDVDREVGKVLSNGLLNKGLADWYIIPVTDDDEQYFAVEPNVKVGNQYYTTVFTSFVLSLNNSADKAYYISLVDGDKAVYTELTGDVPANTPVLIRANSNVVAEHKVTPKHTSLTSITGNQLKGTYFSSSVTGHINRIDNDETIRILGTASDGSLAFVRNTEVAYIPHNTAYLKVSANAPETIKLLSEEEYAEWKEQERLKTPVTLTAVNVTREYGEDNPELSYTVSGTLLGGTPTLSCAATATSPAGTYPIVIARGDVVNTTPTLVNGTLTITPAPLTVKVGNYSREYGEENPAFDITYEGWKNGETEANLTAQPTVKTAATVKSDAGDYALTIEGAVSQNYNITCQSGKLTVTKAPLKATVGNYTREYGDENPTFDITYEGWKNGDTQANFTVQPVVKTEATAKSNVGEYALTIEATSQNYDITCVNGQLTVTKAPLTVSVGTYYTREYAISNPNFRITYDGWKNGDNTKNLTRVPEVQTEATEESHPGIYPLTPVGAESLNYDITYVAGSITITPAPLTISVGTYQREQGQENPEMTPVYEGFRNNDDAADLDKQPVITCEATVDSPVGTYPITVSGAESLDYSITYVNGTLEVVLPAAIGDITVKRNGEFYTLNGTRVSQNAPKHKGIYVIGGRKVVVK